MWWGGACGVSVCDCTVYLVDGNKKDAEYIMKSFQEKVEVGDTSHMYTDCFFMVQQMYKKQEQFLC